MLGECSRTWAIEGGRLRLRLLAYALLAAVLDDAIDEEDIRCAARFGERPSCCSVDLRTPVGDSGMADSEDTVTLGLGGSREEVDEEGEREAELSDDRLCGRSGRALSGASEFGGSIRFPTAAR